MKKYVGIKNVGLVIFGIIIALILSELLLRISGFIYQGILFSKDAKNGETEETYTILCLGDSFTFGYGAPHGKSYPEQLEQLLNSGKKN